jgi:hypothetical protein
MLSFANMVLRNVSDPDSTRGRHRYIDMSRHNTYYHKKQFIALNYVEATNLALSPLDHHRYPIANPLSGVKETMNAIKSYPLKLSKAASTDVKRMYFIELHKERLHIKYKSILVDEDVTKCFEVSVCEHHNQRKEKIR